jgi:hypothetical protein
MGLVTLWQKLLKCANFNNQGLHAKPWNSHGCYGRSLGNHFCNSGAEFALCVSADALIDIVVRQPRSLHVILFQFRKVLLGSRHFRILRVMHEWVYIDQCFLDNMGYSLKVYRFSCSIILDSRHLQQNKLHRTQQYSSPSSLYYLHHIRSCCSAAFGSHSTSTARSKIKDISPDKFCSTPECDLEVGTNSTTPELLYALNYADLGWEEASAKQCTCIEQSARGGGLFDADAIVIEEGDDDDGMVAGLDYEMDTESMNRKLNGNAEPIPHLSGIVSETNEIMTAARTVADGACALHAIWGVLTETVNGHQYYCASARTKLSQRMPMNIQELGDGAVASAFYVELENLREELVTYARQIQKAPALPAQLLGVAIIWDFLPHSTKDDLWLYASKKEENVDMHHTLNLEQDAASRRLFIYEHYEEIKRLCVALQYVSQSDMHKLGAIHDDIDHDPLTLFQPSHHDLHTSEHELKVYAGSGK